MDHIAAIETIPPFAARLEGADHVDVKTAESTRPLDDVIRRMLTYQPVWLRGMYTVRGWMAKVLNLKHEEHPHDDRAEAVILEPGGQATFFVSEAYEPEQYWLGRVEDNHLNAWLGMTAEIRPDNRTLYRCTTIVRHRRWTGPVYFAIIKPFHHLVVRAMLKYAAKETA